MQSISLVLPAYFNSLIHAWTYPAPILHKCLGTISSFPSFTAPAAVFTNTEILWVAKTWKQGSYSKASDQKVEVRIALGLLPQTRANNM